MKNLLTTNKRGRLSRLVMCLTSIAVGLWGSCTPERFEIKEIQIQIQPTSLSQATEHSDTPVYPHAIITKAGQKMVLIPAGEFQMGTDDAIGSFEPAHTIYVDALYMDVYEVTNAQYREFFEATGGHTFSPPYWRWRPSYWGDVRFNQSNHPVVGITWDEAVEYCEWTGKRLPTEAEWEKAARSGLIGKKYPWGDSAPDGTQCNFGDKDEHTGDLMDEAIDDGYRYTASVGSYPPNGYGLYDMAGNVREWCSDWFNDATHYTKPSRNPTGPETGNYRVVRGGDWQTRFTTPSDYNWQIACAMRSREPVTARSDSIGFRCAISVSEVNFTQPPDPIGEFE